MVAPLARFVTEARPAAYEALVAGEHLFAQTVQTFAYLKERAVFRFEASYATRAVPGEAHVVASSTLPFREGRPLMSFEGFSLAANGLLVQRIHEEGRLIERLFHVETCEPFDAVTSTDAAPSAQAWLAAEAGTLLRFSR